MVGTLPHRIACANLTMPDEVYEYAVLVTSLDLEILSIAQLYRDRADAENTFDETKNQWGWGGFTTQDVKRCRLMTRSVALVYNWWSLFGRLADPDRRMEAITSRPLQQGHRWWPNCRSSMVASAPGCRPSSG
jgi:hypothetical protein